MARQSMQQRPRTGLLPSGRDVLHRPDSRSGQICLVETAIAMASADRPLVSLHVLFWDLRHILGFIASVSRLDVQSLTFKA